MKRSIMYIALLSAVCLMVYLFVVRVAPAGNPIKVEVSAQDSTFKEIPADAITQGSLQAIDTQQRPRGFCPLKHTDVKAEISGLITRVTVTQLFHNPFQDKIEAVYTFPLSQSAAVDDMTMYIGERTVRAKIKRREEAQAIYQAARSAGQVASLLEQERPNIFTQSVANIMPGEQVKITISYIETLKYQDGWYEFSFPMVVGPRYIPGNAVGKEGDGWSPDTDRVPDASRITPPVVAKDRRAGHDISIEVAFNTGVAINTLRSTLHEIDFESYSESSGIVRLKKKNEIPNRDFILKYNVNGNAIQDGLITHRAGERGFFTLILQPPEKISAQDVTPKELVFVLDTSGSMEGFPIEKAKETMQLALDNLYPQDTFNLITFSGDTEILFAKPVKATKENLRKAQEFLTSRHGGGGTEMMTAIRAALAPTDVQNHVRIVCFMTDGYVGNDMEIISEVQQHPNARVFSFGIGDSVNRFLLDKMAEHGRGEVEYVTLRDDGSAAARRFHERVRNPLLTDISIEWEGLPISDVYPKHIPDLFGAKPLILSGRYSSGGQGVVRLKGKMAGQDYTREITVKLPESEPRHRALASLWARRRIDHLMGRDFAGLQSGDIKNDVREEITQLGLDYRLMTQFTSFVAVEEKTITEGGQAKRVEVPVEMPAGVSHEGVFDSEQGYSGRMSGGGGGGGVAGVAGGVLGSTSTAVPALPPPPPPPPSAPPPAAASIVSTPSIVKRSEGVIRGNALKHTTPVYPTIARNSHIEGDVVVEVTIDEKGGVQNGRVISGHPLLQQAALRAVRQWKFKPTLLNNIPVKVQSVLTFRFKLDEKTKMHPDIAELIEHTSNNTSSSQQATFVKNGRASVKIELSDRSDQVFSQLQQIGLEVVKKQKNRNVIIGRCPLEKLKELVQLNTVLYVEPAFE
ncbi:MAG: TonB family protein [Acidobacteriota bacterium]